MKKGSLALVASSQRSSWVSCQIITPNLERAYSRWHGGGIERFSLSTATNEYEICRLAQEIRAADPDRIAFVDHRPHPGALIHALRGAYHPRPLPPMYFHVYGDFSLDTPHWSHIEDVLGNNRVCFIAASERQKDYVSHLLRPSAAEVGICPFPVDSSRFFHDPASAGGWRRRWGARDSDWVIAYSGRMTLQKNVHVLLQAFAEFAAETSKPVQLWVAGGFDDLGAPFFGVRPLAGGYFRVWQSHLLRLPKEIRDRVHYVGNITSSELRGFYNAADVFVSLSLHHDEDFGMSPAEALCSGTPALLTDWGGYASFALRGASEQGHCQLVPVSLGTKGLRVKRDELVGKLHALTNTREAPGARRARSDLYHKHFSIEAAAQALGAIHARKLPPFEGFSWRMHELARSFAAPVPFPEGPRPGTFYEEIYAKYLRPSRLVFHPRGIDSGAAKEELQR